MNNLDELIGKDYEGFIIDKKIATGGFMAVFEGHATYDFEKKVAIKLPLNEEYSSRLVKDIRNHAVLKKHRNIIELIHSNPYIKEPYAIYELAETSLNRLLDKKRFTLEEAVFYAEQILQGIKYMHQKEIIHGDLKPGNILLCKEEEKLIPKISDFNQAYMEKRISEDSIMVSSSLSKGERNDIGSILYLSPEHINGKPLQKISDIHQWGQIFYEMATGTKFYERDEEPEIPENIKRIIRKATAKDPSKRYADADAIISELQDSRREPIKLKDVNESIPLAPENPETGDKEKIPDDSKTSSDDSKTSSDDSKTSSDDSKTSSNALKKAWSFITKGPRKWMLAGVLGAGIITGASYITESVFESNMIDDARKEFISYEKRLYLISVDESRLYKKRLFLAPDLDNLPEVYDLELTSIRPLGAHRDTYIYATEEKIGNKMAPQIVKYDFQNSKSYKMIDYNLERNKFLKDKSLITDLEITLLENTANNQIIPQISFYETNEKKEFIYDSNYFVKKEGNYQEYMPIKSFSPNFEIVDKGGKVYLRRTNAFWGDKVIMPGNKHYITRSDYDFKIKRDNDGSFPFEVCFVAGSILALAIGYGATKSKSQ